MSVEIAPGVGLGLGKRPAIGWVAALAAALTVVALAFASPASAGVTGTATLAPIGTGNYLLTVQNTGDSEVRNLTAGGPGEGFKNFDGANCVALGGGFGCGVSIAPGASFQLCYSGPAVTAVTLEVNLAHLAVAAAPAIASCPLPGFTPIAAPVTPPPPTTGGGPASGPTFSLGKAKDDTHKGTATLVVNLPGSGSLVLSGKGVKGVTANPKGPDATTLIVKATGKAASKLATNGKVKVKVSVTFTPTGGSPSTLTKSVKLVKQIPGK